MYALWLTCEKVHYVYFTKTCQVFFFSMLCFLYDFDFTLASFCHVPSMLCIFVMTWLSYASIMMLMKFFAWNTNCYCSGLIGDVINKLWLIALFCIFGKHFYQTVISKVNIAFLICIAELLHMIHFILHFLGKTVVAGDYFFGFAYVSGAPLVVCKDNYKLNKFNHGCWIKVLICKISFLTF